MNKPTKTDLERFDAMTDEMIDTSDSPPLTEAFFATAKWRIPGSRTTTLEYFESYEAAAEFWDTHDTTDYADEFHTVEVNTEMNARHFEAEIVIPQARP